MSTVFSGYKEEAVEKNKKIPVSEHFGFMSIQTQVKSKEPNLGSFSLSLIFIKSSSNQERRKKQRNSNREGQQWCVEVRLWDSGGRTRQCRRQEEREEFSPLKTLLWEQQSIEFEENKVQGETLSFSFSLPKNPRLTQSLKREWQWVLWVTLHYSTCPALSKSGTLSPKTSARVSKIREEKQLKQDKI